MMAVHKPATDKLPPIARCTWRNRLVTNASASYWWHRDDRGRRERRPWLSPRPLLSSPSASRPNGSGIAVGLLHTGSAYDDDLFEDGVIYHFPVTNRPGRRDASERQHFEIYSNSTFLSL